MLSQRGNSEGFSGISSTLTSTLSFLVTLLFLEAGSTKYVGMLHHLNLFCVGLNVVSN
jgi:hypothetical protein